MVKSVMLRFDKFLHETQRAYLIRVGQNEHWIPKKLCRKFVTNKKLGGNVVIPTFKYEEIMNCKVDELSQFEIDQIADVVFEKHVPTRIEPKTTMPDASLIR